MGQKLKFIYLSILLFWPVSIVHSQSNAPPYGIPANITVDVVDPASFELNTTTESYPIIDLIENTYGNSAGISLIYPVLSTNDPVSALSDAVNQGSVAEVIVQMPFETYVKGVVRAETFPTWNQIETFKTQAVASRSYAAGYAIPYKAESEIISNGVTYTYDTIGNTEDQVYVPYVPSLAGWDGDSQGDDGIAGQGTTLTVAQAIYCFDRNHGQTGPDQIIFGAFSSSFGGESNDEIFFNVDGHWGFPPYLKSRQSGDTGQGVKISSGLGLSQYGANNLAQPSPGWNYQGILNYFYAVNPPIVRAVDIYQDNSSTDQNLRYSFQWN